MRLEIRMPRLSEFSNEGVIKKWLVKVGDTVQKGDAVASVDIDMSITEILAEAAGKIDEIWVHVGQTVPVETIIAMQSIDDTAIDEEPVVEKTRQEAAVEEKPVGEFDIFPELGDETNPYVDPETESATGDNEDPVVINGYILASPDAIQLAEQQNINLGTLIGTGSCGLIERADVEAAMQTKSQFITIDDVDDLMNFEGDFSSKLPSDEPTPPQEAEAEFDSAMAGQTEEAQTGQWEEVEVPTESTDTELDAPVEEPAPPAEVTATATDETVSTSEVIYMGAGPEADDAPETADEPEADDAPETADEPEADDAPETADDPEALSIDESDTINTDKMSNAESEPVKLDEKTVAQIIEQSVSQPLRKPVRLRRLVARKMQQSWQQAPHFFVTVAVDMTDVIRFRSDLGVTINDFILTATTRSLLEHPWVNSHFVDDEAREQSAINISLAVETEEGLYYPVIKDCAGKSVKELGIASAEMVVKAHSGKLAEEDMADGGFTISNMGMLGVESFSAIITPPQVAVLAVGTVRGEVIIDENEEMSMAPMVRLTLSGDHRALDGADAADFLGTMKSYLEAPITLVAPQDDI